MFVCFLRKFKVNEKKKKKIESHYFTDTGTKHPPFFYCTFFLWWCPLTRWEQLWSLSRCSCWSQKLRILAFLLTLIAVSAAIFYLVVKPRSPNYSVNAISISGVNLTVASSASLTVSPEFNVTVRADYLNNKIGIYYKPKSSIEIYYDDVSLCNGAVPSFYQPSNNVTVFETTLKGYGVVLTSMVKNSLLQAQTQGKVTIRAPVKIKVGSVKSWTITIKVDCDIMVDSLTANPKIFSLLSSTLLLYSPSFLNFQTGH